MQPSSPDPFLLAKSPPLVKGWEVGAYFYTNSSYHQCLLLLSLPNGMSPPWSSLRSTPDSHFRCQGLVCPSPQSSLRLDLGSYRLDYAHWWMLPRHYLPYACAMCRLVPKLSGLVSPMQPQLPLCPCGKSRPLVKGWEVGCLCYTNSSYHHCVSSLLLTNGMSSPSSPSVPLPTLTPVCVPRPRLSITTTSC